MLRIGLLRLLSLGIVVAVLFAVGMLVSWHPDRARLAAIARAVAPENLSDGDKADRLMAWVYANQGFEKNRRRFIWAKLETVGIDGSMPMQYPCRGCEAVHTIVLADIGDRWAAYDPVYNLSFPNRRGGYYDIAELRARPELLPERLDELIAVHGAGDKIAKYGREDHVFTYITTVNRDKNALTRTVASMLPVFGLEPALTPRPFFLDNPKQFFATAGFGTGLFFAVLSFAALPLRRRRTVAAPGTTRAATHVPSVAR